MGETWQPTQDVPLNNLKLKLTNIKRTMIMMKKMMMMMMIMVIIMMMMMM